VETTDINIRSLTPSGCFGCRICAICEICGSEMAVAPAVPPVSLCVFVFLW
jgi:hypothetical protein